MPIMVAGVGDRVGYVSSSGFYSMVLHDVSGWGLIGAYLGG